MVQAVSVKYIPFYYVFAWLWDVVTFRTFRKLDEFVDDEERAKARGGFAHHRNRPRVAGGGANLPLLVIAALSEWLAVLDARGTGGQYFCFAGDKH